MDELYVIARRVLLDALDALGEHRDATIRRRTSQAVLRRFSEMHGVRRPARGRWSCSASCLTIGVAKAQRWRRERPSP